MLRKMCRWTAAVVAFPLLAAGCSDDSTSAQTAHVSVVLTDESGDVEHAWVEIGEIYLQGGGAPGRVTLLEEVAADALGLIELTELAGRTLEIVEGVEIPAANYGQLRFVIEGAVIETEGGDVFTYNATHPDNLPSNGSLNCPSCTQTGIAVLLPGEVADLEAGAHLIVLDFDVSQSFGREAGQSGTWVMSPVIHAAELGFTGAVTGTVDVQRDGDGTPLVVIPACPEGPPGTPRDLTAFVPRAVAQTLTDDMGDPVTATTIVAADGSFSFPFLHPDEYDFGFVANVDFDGSTLTFDADAPGLMDVTSGGNLVVTYTITSAECTT